VNPFRTFQKHYKAARYRQQAEKLDVGGKSWLTQAELWEHDPDSGTPEMIAGARARGEHLCGWAQHLLVEAAWEEL
jgi:hypothetical protein